jgi:hypothetical protein
MRRIDAIGMHPDAFPTEFADLPAGQTVDDRRGGDNAAAVPMSLLQRKETSAINPLTF